MNSFLMYNLAFVSLWMFGVSIIGFPIFSYKYKESLRLKEERERMTHIFYGRYIAEEDLYTPPPGYSIDEWNKIRDKELKKLEESK